MVFDCLGNLCTYLLIEPENYTALHLALQLIFTTCIHLKCNNSPCSLMFPVYSERQRFFDNFKDQQNISQMRILTTQELSALWYQAVFRHALCGLAVWMSQIIWLFLSLNNAFGKILAMLFSYRYLSNRQYKTQS